MGKENEWVKPLGYLISTKLELMNNIEQAFYSKHTGIGVEYLPK